MKKTALTFVAVAFGTCVAFAQTTPTEEQKNQTQQGVTIDKMSDRPEDDMFAGRQLIELEQLPEAIREKLNSGEFDDWKVARIAELDASAIQRLSNTETEFTTTETTTAPAGKQYEIVLIPEDVKEEAMDAKEDVQDEVEDAVEDGELNEGAEATVKVPGVIIRFDEQGNLLSRTERSDIDLNKLKKEQHKTDY